MLNYPGSRSGQDLLFCAITLKASDKTVAEGLLEITVELQWLEQAWEHENSF